ncbi:MAG: hypothetical protein IPK16_25945 [Anaerolineales bacterium]|nr:hypothetical protein [Anaerolineales bacterium]
MIGRHCFWRMSRGAPVGVALALGLTLFVVLALPVGAEPNAGTTITVTSTAPDTGGPDCKLRDAFTAANTGGVAGGCDGSSGGPYTIVLAPGATYTLIYTDNIGMYGHANGLPQVTAADVTVVGNMAVIQRGDAVGVPEFRFLEVMSRTTLTLNRVVLQNAKADDEGDGAALQNWGVVHILASIIANNQTFCGGAISNVGEMTITNSLITQNRAFG